MLECLSVTPGVTCHPWPGETEAMSHQRGSPPLILLLSPVLHCFYSNSCFTGRKERLLAVLGSINLEPVGVLSSGWFQVYLNISISLCCPQTATNINHRRLWGRHRVPCAGRRWRGQCQEGAEGDRAVPGRIRGSSPCPCLSPRVPAPAEPI